MTIYANIERGDSYYGENIPVEVISKRGVWFICKFPSGKIKEIHRDYMTATGGTKELDGEN